MTLKCFHSQKSKGRRKPFKIRPDQEWITCRQMSEEGRLGAGGRQVEGGHTITSACRGEGPGSVHQLPRPVSLPSDTIFSVFNHQEIVSW